MRKIGINNYLLLLVVLTAIVLGFNLVDVRKIIGIIDFKLISTFVVLIATSILTLQGIITLVWMLYAWNNPEKIDSAGSPKRYAEPKFSFTAIVPVRFEEKVIKDTIRAISKINYPKELSEIIIVVRYDDKESPVKVQEVINEIGAENIKLQVLLGSYPINKPNKLNYALKAANGDIIAIFDAEDEPHRSIYNIVNTVMIRDNADVVQSGVQLVNYNSHWFSPLNVLEYFFWFKSGLHFFTNVGRVSPLGGNTVFFKRNYLDRVGGWDDKCLTEDADVGIRLTLAGAKTVVIYDEMHVTREETPSSTSGFIKQRTRWVQGFLQIFLKGDWKRLPQRRQRLTVLYILFAPLIPAALTVYMPVGIAIGFLFDLPILVSMYSFVPTYILLLIVFVQIVGLYEFCRAYGYKFSASLPFKLALTFMPYVFILSYSSIRAFWRIYKSENEWEKTLHANVHREMVKF